METTEMEISVLRGKTLLECFATEDESEIIFKTNDGRTYKLYHQQDCCESVTVEDICGKLSDLVGSPIIQADMETSNDPAFVRDNYKPESLTWTFYRLATADGFVVIRWFGESNGYYSEAVTFAEVK